ncbi:Uncharacterized protein APZ42_029048 [Daphnia magna]|uniref:Uncharacterized protein n=1 Tax=Daphnia magna TaxID=35525 RepID=A0A164PYX6_9CRUS|nr:Uncharacterized protein APZ42_029048 [Daphnia magna]
MEKIILRLHSLTDTNAHPSKPLEEDIENIADIIRAEISGAAHSQYARDRTTDEINGVAREIRDVEIGCWCKGPFSPRPQPNPPTLPGVLESESDKLIPDLSDCEVQSEVIKFEETPALPEPKQAEERRVRRQKGSSESTNRTPRTPEERLPTIEVARIDRDTHRRRFILKNLKNRIHNRLEHVRDQYYVFNQRFCEANRPMSIAYYYIVVDEEFFSRQMYHVTIRSLNHMIQYQGIHWMGQIIDADWVLLDPSHRLETSLCLDMILYLESHRGEDTRYLP